MSSERNAQSVQLLLKAAQKVVNARQAGERVLECVERVLEGGSLQDASPWSSQAKALQDVNLYNQVKLLQQIVKTSEDGLHEESKKPKEELWRKHNAMTKASMVHKRCHPAQVAFEVEEQALFPMWVCPRRSAGDSPMLKRLRSKPADQAEQLKRIVGNVTSSTKLEVSFWDGDAAAQVAAEGARCLVARLPRVLRAVIVLEKAGGCLPVRVAVFGDDEGVTKGGGSQATPWGASRHELFRRISDQAMLVLHTLKQQSRAEDVLHESIDWAAAGGGEVGGGEPSGGMAHLWRSPGLEQLLLWVACHDDACTRACSGCGRLLAAHPMSRSLLPPYIRLLPAIRSPVWQKSAYHPQCVPMEDMHYQPAAR